MTIDEVVKTFVDVFNDNKKDGDEKSNFYCGITNDLERRKREHKLDDFLYTVKCKNFEAASALEKELEEVGFDCGSQIANGRSDTIYGYIYIERHQIRKSR